MADGRRAYLTGLTARHCSFGLWLRKKGKWQTANNNNTEMMWNVLEQCTEWQRMNCLIAFLVCDISWGHNYCVQMILWRHTHSRTAANWNNKWINYLHLVRSSMECVNEKSTELAACRICVICTDSVRHNDNNVDGMDWRIRCSKVCVAHRIQFVVLIIVCVHLFHRLRHRLRLNEWIQRQQQRCHFHLRTHSTSGVDFMTFHFSTTSQPSRNEISTCSRRTQRFLWSARDEMEWELFLFYFVFRSKTLMRGDERRWSRLIFASTTHRSQEPKIKGK